MRAIYNTTGRAKEYCDKAVNLYSTCGHLCTYCYGANVTHQTPEQFFRDAEPRRGILQQIHRDAIKMYALKDHGPVLMCFITDPYQPVEARHRATRHAIDIMHANKIDVTILTKAGILAQRDFDLLGPRDTFATTLTCVREDQAIPWEPKAASPQDRIANLRAARDRDIKTWVSFEPVIEPSWTFELIRMVAGDVDLIKVGTMNYHEHGKTVDWRRFGHEVKDLLEQLGTPYYLKKDLREAMGVA